MKINIRNMYGLNNYKDFDFSSNSRFNLIYGENAIGKSSITKSLKHILTRQEYIPQILDDSKEFNLSLDFDGKTITYNNKSDKKYLESINMDKKLYIFDRKYTSNSIFINSKLTSKIELGIRLKEKNELNEMNTNKLSVISSDIKKILETNQLPNTIGNLKEGSKIAETLRKNDKIEHTYKLLEKEIATEKIPNDFESQDFYKENLNYYTMFKNTSRDLNEYVISELQKNNNVSKYKIYDVSDKEFYESVIIYFSEKETENFCPICYTGINRKEIKEEIKKCIESLMQKQFSKIFDIIYKGIKPIKTQLANNIKTQIEMFIKGIYNKIEINKINEKITFLNDKYDTILFQKIQKAKDFSSEYKIIVENNKVIKEITEKNKDIQTNDFITILQENLDKIFKHGNLKIKASLKLNVDNEPCISLKINDLQKEELNVEKLYNNILSESQKTKLSIAFFFSLIKYEHYKEGVLSKILCIFDDPIDSYDSISKYDISLLIHNFIIENNSFYECYSIILTHSVDYFRIYQKNFLLESSTEKAYFLLTKLGVSKIDENHLFLFDGDFVILNKIIKKNVMKETQENVKLFEFLSMIPILRELACYTTKNIKIEDINNSGNTQKPVINGLKIDKLENYLDNTIIHGLFRKNEKISSFCKEIARYTNINLEDITKIKDKTIKEYMEEYIKLSKPPENNFYETIVYKNILAIYIRAAIDDYLVKIIYDNEGGSKTVERISKDYVEIGKKLSEISSNVAWNYDREIFDYISSKLNLFNDFAHSANLYLTPLIDVKIEDLLEIYNDLFNKFDNIYNKNFKDLI